MANQNNLIKISAETRRSIFNKIMSYADFIGVFHRANYEDQNIVDFLKLIWDFPAMHSEDHRFKNAEADAIVYGRNHWKIVMYYDAATSTVFKSYIMTQLNLIS